MKPAWLVFAGLAAVSAAATWFVYSNGWTLYYGDAEAHLDIARRVIDSRTPGYDQIGTVWLPLPHALMIPFVANDRLWRSGLAGAVPSSIAFIVAGMFLFAGVRRLFASGTAGVAAAACFALNPNLLYLQAIPMNEVLLFAGLLAGLYCTVAFAQTGRFRFVIGAAVANLAAALTRYEGWFVIPFVGAYLVWVAQRRKLAAALVFFVIASLGPLYWLAHNWWYFGNAIDFYNGPYSAKAIQGLAHYPGKNDWEQAWLYFRSAAILCGGWGALVLSAVGLLAALVKRVWWPLVFLSLAPVFYVWSMHSSGIPIFIPTLWPHTYYNSRYGLAAWPLIAFCAGASLMAVPVQWRRAGVAFAALLAILPWVIRPMPDAWVCWKESQVNSIERRAWTHQTAAFLAEHYRSASGIFGAMGDVAGAYREAEIPFREVLQDGNEPEWEAAVQRPDLFLHEEWAVAMKGDRVAKAAAQAHYELVATIKPSIEIYKRR